MSKVSARLYYVYDPMCAWCWGYKPAWQTIESKLQDTLSVTYVVGGLAPDSDVPMPMEMRQQIASYWQKIEALLGTQFNHEFWQTNTPRRSTYPSCRAMLAARLQGKEKSLLTAVQHAYYLQARNPSNVSTLEALAEETGLDVAAFRQAMSSDEIEQQLQSELAFARSIGGNSFPSLFVEKDSTVIEVPVDYRDPMLTIKQIEKVLESL
ncbi:DsbA family protein [Vibrio rarus]|uniref:DsbA family protein n=1 Tax=Vibrio rarus TaxID=413403 RepID=UPI0021C3ACF6|nr:DsbA family protein [Vibrio rarus]